MSFQSRQPHILKHVNCTPALLSVVFSLRQQKLRISWKAMRSQWRQLIWQMNSLFC